MREENGSEGVDMNPKSTCSRLEHELLEMMSKRPMTRPYMVEELGIPRTTIYDALKRLMERGEVKRYPEFPNGRGRPKVLFALVGYEIGIPEETHHEN